MNSAVPFGSFSNTWLQGLKECLNKQTDFVLVSIVNSRGSTPRRAGAKMLVSRHQVWDTVGGGSVEQDLILKARASIESGESMICSYSYNDNSGLALACGGMADYLIDPVLEK